MPQVISAARRLKVVVAERIPSHELESFDGAAHEVIDVQDSALIHLALKVHKI